MAKKEKFNFSSVPIGEDPTRSPRDSEPVPRWEIDVAMQEISAGMAGMKHVINTQALLISALVKVLVRNSLTTVAEYNQIMADVAERVQQLEDEANAQIASKTVN